MEKQKLIDIFRKYTPKTEMSESETMLMFNLIMSEDQNLSGDIEFIDMTSDVYKHFEPIIKSFQSQVFLSRLKHMTSLKISLGALIILMHHMESAGKAVMHVFYLHSKVPANTVVTVKTIAELFPMGFFSNHQLNKIWDEQKVRTEDSRNFTCIGAPDNMIDYLETWK